MQKVVSYGELYGHKQLRKPNAVLGLILWLDSKLTTGISINFDFLVRYSYKNEKVRKQLRHLNKEL